MAKGVGKRQGVVRYNKKILLDEIRKFKPISRLEWESVAINYQKLTGEKVIREVDDIKRQFITKMCDNNKKPTGKAAPKASVEAAQKVYRKMLEKSGAGNYGGSDDYDDDDSDDVNANDELKRNLVITFPASVAHANANAANTSSSVATNVSPSVAVNANSHATINASSSATTDANSSAATNQNNKRDRSFSTDNKSKNKKNNFGSIPGRQYLAGALTNVANSMVGNNNSTELLNKFDQLSNSFQNTMQSFMQQQMQMQMMNMQLMMGMRSPTSINPMMDMSTPPVPFYIYRLFIMRVENCSNLI